MPVKGSLMLQYRVLSVLTIFSSCAIAADWQFTAAAGFGAYHPVTYRSPAGPAQAGIGPRYTLEAAAGRQWGERFALEAAWSFQDGDFEISSGGRKTAFDANSHAAHVDVVAYLRRASAGLRPYAVAGAGAKFYHGIEAMNPRPLGEFGSFRDGVDMRAMLAFGGGIEWTRWSHWGLRLDVRDSATPFPTSVIVPAPGSHFSGWLHDLAATAGITVRLPGGR